MSAKSDTSATSVYRPSLELEPDYRVEIQQFDSTISTSIVLHRQSPRLQTQASTVGASAGTISVAVLPTRGDLPQEARELDLVKALVLALWPHFAHRSSVPKEFEVVPTPPNQTLGAALEEMDFRICQGGIRRGSENGILISRGAVFQLFKYACTSSTQGPPLFPYVATETAGTIHPLRPKKPEASSAIYSRHIAHLDQFFSLHVAGPSDLDTLHEWLNDERVDVFWQEKGTLEQHHKFLADRTVDAHVLPVIGSYLSETTPVEQAHVSNEPATYSEIYWVKEDRLGPLIDEVQDYDRGLHMLVGSNAHRGPHRVRAWMPSLVHYCFLDDPRTQRVVCEPNEKNVKVLDYLQSIGFQRHGCVEFPHKTSALMIIDRVRFYELFPF
ncbi:BQ2448_7605 [Microbotryum intermedium]|uniref:BQ2448_7605 protein n=1 Tax=Microbotryum intermedium TaxID=269621 RepID=A0A238FU24_9BASI|nr:BQ2448_7605 [Microbotryum intermedium]